MLDRICEHTYIFKFILKASRVNVMLNSVVKGCFGVLNSNFLLLSSKMYNNGSKLKNPRWPAPRS